MSAAGVLCALCAAGADSGENQHLGPVERRGDARLAPQNMSDALRELKQLLDDGVLTQEEFNAKKQQILNL